MRVLVGSLLMVSLGVGIPPAHSQTSSAAPVRRAADGKPDFSGIWQSMSTAHWDLEDHSAAVGVPAGQIVVEAGSIPYQPWALAKRSENRADSVAGDPLAKCYQPGVPRGMYLPFPFQIVQTPTYIGMAFEYIHGVRHLYFGSEHPKGHIDWWMGDSRARWEGDSLVVDVTHFDPTTWFDKAGNFHSDALHLVERYTLRDSDHIDYEVTVEDPKVFTRPWKMSLVLYRRVETGFQILDYECHSFHAEPR